MTNIFDRIRVYKICGIARNFMQNIYITCENRDSYQIRLYDRHTETFVERRKRNHIR